LQVNSLAILHRIVSHIGGLRENHALDLGQHYTIPIKYIGIIHANSVKNRN
jgi:hypothetical protein